MTEGDRLPPEASDDSPHVGRYYGPFDSEPWLPPDQPMEPQVPPAEGETAAAPPGRSRRRRSPGLVIAAAGLTALLVGGGAGYGGALLAGRTTEREAAPSASTQTSATPDSNTTGGPSPNSGAPASQPGRSLVEVADAVLPSTVMIQAGSGTGSGFVLDAEGHIMTNNHVIAAANGARLRIVLSNGRRLNATLLGRSSSYDLAILQVQAPSLKPLQIGNSDAINVGEPVLAVGSPLGLPGTVTSGIVSARNRPVVVRETLSADAPIAYINAIQTDAPINPGNSGGPLVDSSARVIGVNSAILTGPSRGQSGSIGLGFAIPINQAVQIAELLIKTGKATYPVIGASVEESGGDYGVVLTSVETGGPAADAGLREGDVVTRIDGKRVTTVEELIVTIRTHRPRETVVLDYERDDARRQARIVLGSREG